jgi:hypothetical protein
MSQLAGPAPRKIARSERFFHGRLLQAYERAQGVVEAAMMGETQILPILGPTRTGKTELVEALLADYPTQERDGRICKPVIRVSTPMDPSLRSMSLSLIRGLEGRVLSKVSTADLHDQALRQLKVAGVKVILFDEIPHLAEHGRRQDARRAADMLKVLDASLHISMILMGLPSAERLRGQNEQFRDRCLATELIYPYAWVSAADRQGFEAGVELIFEAYREAGWTIALEGPDLLKRLYAACIGRFGRLIDLFSHAETNNTEQLIDLKRLDASYRHCIVNPFIAANPFHPSTNLSDQELNAAFAKVLKEAHLPMPIF